MERASWFVLLATCMVLTSQFVEGDVTQTRKERPEVRPFAPSFVQLASQTNAHADQKFVGSMIRGAVNGVKKLLGVGGGKGTGAADEIASTDQKCVTCQYVIQRIRGEMLMEGIGGGLPFGVSPALVGVPQYESMGEIDNPAGVFTPPPPGGGGAAPDAAAAPAAPPAPGFLELAEAMTKIAAKEDAEESSSLLEVNQIGSIINAGRSIGSKIMRGLTPKNGDLDLYRDRTTQLLKFRPTSARYANLYDGPLRAAQRAQARFENNQIYAVVYHVVQAVCVRMPKPFFGWCAQLLTYYQTLTEGLRGGDRPDAICLKTKFCDDASYIFKGPHAIPSS